MDTVCPDCGCKNSEWNSKTGERVCSKCGLVIDDYHVDNKHEWRSLDQDEISKKVRTGAPSTYLIHDKGLSTVVGWSHKDQEGITSSQKSQYYRLMKWQRRLSSKEQSLVTGLSKLESLSSHLDLQKNIRETASIVYRKALDNNLIKGRSIDIIIAASVYIVCRQCRISRSLDEIADAIDVRRKDVGKAYRLMLRKLEINLTPPHPIEYIPRFASELSLPEEVQLQAETIVRELMDDTIKCGRNPVAIAAAALYISTTISGVTVSQKDISKVANTSEVTLRNRCKELCDRIKAHHLFGKEVMLPFS